MSLIWHIVRKDTRRLWLPLTLWLVLRLAHTALVAYVWSLGEVSAAAFTSLRYFSGVWGGVISAVGFILAAWLVMEDSLVSPAAFWVTRPISGVRLLAAKAAGALLLLSVLPVVVLFPVWLMSGFSTADLFRAAFPLALDQAVLSLAAFALACVTETSGQFLFRMIGGLFILPLSVSYAFGRLSSADHAIGLGLLASRTRLAVGLSLLTMVAMIVHQFMSRRTARSWMLGGCGFLLILAVGAGWSWDFSRAYDGPFLTGEEARDPSTQSISFQAGPMVMGNDYLQRGRTQMRLQGMVTGAPAGDYVRVNFIRGGWRNDADWFLLWRDFFTSADSWVPPAGTIRQVAGFASENVAGVWTIDADEPNESVTRARARNMTLRLELNATLMRGHAVGELPLRAGAELREDASLTRVVGVKHEDGKVVLILNERNACLRLSGGGLADERIPSSSTGARLVDSYVIVDRAHVWDQVPTVNEIGSMVISSILINQRQLVVVPPTREVGGRTEQIPDWEETAVIVKIRFQPDHDFSAPLTINPFATTARP